MARPPRYLLCWRYLFFFVFLFPFVHLEAEAWKRVYLASYPRSGNTWTRQLIEEASHIATCSVYADKTTKRHMPLPFPWGGFAVCGGYQGNCRYPTERDAILIKTHYPCQSAARYDSLKSVKTILLVRDPIDAIYSYYEMRYGQKGLPASMPREHLEWLTHSWRQFYEYWHRQPNVVTIRYEDLYRKPASTLTQMIQILGYLKVQQADIQRAVKTCSPEGGLRKHHAQFSREELQYIRQQLGDLMRRYGYS